jgi:hypothetical protein
MTFLRIWLSRLPSKLSDPAADNMLDESKDRRGSQVR